MQEPVEARREEIPSLLNRRMNSRSVTLRVHEAVDRAVLEMKATVLDARMHNRPGLHHLQWFTDYKTLS